MAVSFPVLLGRIRLAARAPEALAAFFVEALGFEREAARGEDQRLRLGESRLDIAQASGAAYPGDVADWSPLFQHFAITTPDMAASMERLDRVPGWTAISRAGPQQLPASSGGVSAFKFRDPEGHPLELIRFPQEGADVPPRIDHSAISVAFTARSVAFYEALGFVVGPRSLNRGPAQDRLDGLEDAQVEVTALLSPAGGPHVELLCYRGDYPREVRPAGVADVAATRLVLSLDEAAAQAVKERFADRAEWDDPSRALLLRDPDGHLLQIEPPPAAPPTAR